MRLAGLCRAGGGRPSGRPLTARRRTGPLRASAARHRSPLHAIAEPALPAEAPFDAAVVAANSAMVRSARTGWRFGPVNGNAVALTPASSPAKYSMAVLRCSLGRARDPVGPASPWRTAAFAGTGAAAFPRNRRTDTGFAAASPITPSLTQNQSDLARFLFSASRFSRDRQAGPGSSPQL